MRGARPLNFERCANGRESNQGVAGDRRSDDKFRGWFSAAGGCASRAESDSSEKGRARFSGRKEGVKELDLPVDEHGKPLGSPDELELWLAEGTFRRSWWGFACELLSHRF